MLRPGKRGRGEETLGRGVNTLLQHKTTITQKCAYALVRMFLRVLVRNSGPLTIY